MTDVESMNVVKISLKTALKNLKPSVEMAMAMSEQIGVLKINVNGGMTWLQLFTNLKINIGDGKTLVIKSGTGNVISRITDSIAEHVSKCKSPVDVYVAKIMKKATKQVYKPPIMKRISKKKKAKVTNGTPVVIGVVKRGRKPKVRNEVVVSTNASAEMGAGNVGRVEANSSVAAEIPQHPLPATLPTADSISEDARVERVESQPKLEREKKEDPKKSVLAVLDRDVNNSILWRMKKEFDDINESGDWLDLVTPRIPRLGNLISTLFSDSNFKRN